MQQFGSIENVVIDNVDDGYTARDVFVGSLPFGEQGNLRIARNS